MAIKKVINTPYGVKAEYHRIAVTNVDWVNRTANIALVVYINKEAREAGSKHIEASQKLFSGETFDYTCEDNIVAKTYTKLMALPEFEGAEEC